MEAHAFPDLKTFHLQPCLFSAAEDGFARRHGHIPMTDFIGQWDFNMVYDPADDPAVTGHIPQYQAASGTEAAFHAVEKGLGIRIVVETHGTDNGIEGISFKGKILTVSHYESAVFQILFPCLLYHGRSQIKTDAS